ncbi:MAG: hypothetical protein WDM84_04345 [Bauldia sp.]
MSSRAFCLAVCLMLAAATAHANSPIEFDQDNSGSISFETPSGNIGCIFIPAGGTEVYVPADGGPELSCDRVAPSYLRFTLSTTGPAALISNVGDQGCCGGPNTLPYGEFWEVPPFTCWSATSGLTCKRDDGHGFFISKAKVSAY